MNAILITLLQFMSFTGIGGVAALYLVQKGWISKHYLLITAFGVSSFVGYILFFVYAKSIGTGTFLSGLLYVCGIMACAVLTHLVLKKDKTSRLLTTCLLTPLALVLVVLGFYSAISLSCQSRSISSSAPYNVNQACLLANAPGDNVLPLFFGDKLLANEDAVTSPGDWKLADRPPLEIGATIGILDIIPSDSTKLAAYQIFGSFLQLGWIAAIWALLKSTKTSRNTEKLVWFGTIFSGFFFYNSIYLWPKLLSAAFVLAAIGLVVNAKKKPVTQPSTMVFVGAFAALGLLSHGGVLFTLIPFALLLLLPRHNPGVRYLCLAAAVFSIMYAPWALYHAHTTTSDRLVKYQLAGEPELNNTSTTTAIRKAYSSLTLGDWADGRVKNIEAYFVKDSSVPIYHVKHPAGHSTVFSTWREHEFLVTFLAFGFFNIAWAALLFPKIRHTFSSDEASLLKDFGLIAGVSLLLNALLIFVPGSTVIHQGSYATMILLFIIVLLILGKLPKKLQTIVLTLQISLFFASWVMSVYTENAQSRFVAGLISLVALATVALLVNRSTRVTS